MPLYQYIDKKTNAEVNVIRSMDDRNTPPSEAEIAEAKLGFELVDPEWERQITRTKFTRGAGWQYQKGARN